MFQLGILSNSIHLLNTNGFDMNTYPNILTPPMDSPASMLSPDSGCGSPPYLIPHSNSTSSYGIYDYATSPIHDAGPYIKILEQPVDRFRFRYKSEMSGTHGSLNGKSSDRSRKQTFPCVELVNYHKPAVIRCSLYQYGKEDMAHTRQLHAHRLVKKQGTDEIDDPHDIQVNAETGFTANFHSMGIIHTAKKFIVPELVRKNTILKREDIARTEHKYRSLTKKEELEIKLLAEKESKCINLNVVCLRFDAYEVINNIYYPICTPVYTHGINNLKSALTGDLKIVRMDHCTSTCRGGREIFILVEKVTKKNVKVRFFELDDEDNEVWSDYGRFSDLDVHHQYAIVFKTPPYKRMDIEHQVRVYIELQRPSDGARSEPKDFAFTPCEITLGKKRPRYNSEDYSSSQFSTEDLPLTLNHISPSYEIQTVSNPTNEYVNSEDLEAALHRNNVDSSELDNLYKSFIENELLFTTENISTRELKNLGLVMDTPIVPSSNTKKTLPSSISTCSKQVVNKEQSIIDRVKTEIYSFVKTNPNTARMTMMLKNLICGENYIVSGGNNVLHLLANENNSKNHFSKYLLQLLSEYKQSSLLDITNLKGQTPLHIAVEACSTAFIEKLIEAQANASLPDHNGNTALHIAVIKNAPSDILNLLLSPPCNVNDYINNFNYDGKTPLHLAVKMNNLNATKLLILNHADVNLNEMKLGCTPLHLAVTDQNLEITNFLLENADIMCDKTDFREYTALKLAKVLINKNQPITEEVYDVLEKFMKKNGTFTEVFIDEVADISDEEVEELKVELENSSLNLNYNNITNFTEDCLNALSDILDKTKNWRNLAELLDYGHLLKTNIFESVERPTKSLLNFAIGNGDTVKQIRDILDSLNETAAVKIIDSMVEKV